MKLSMLLFAVGLLMVLLQTTVLQFFPVVPDLILVLCVYWGLHHPTVGAVLGAFVLGYSLDVVSSPILGVNAFAMSLVFLAVYLSSRSIWLHNHLISAIVVILASLVKGLALVIVWALFLSQESFWIGALRYIMVDAMMAALFAPVVFSLLRRGQLYLERVQFSGL